MLRRLMVIFLLTVPALIACQCAMSRRTSEQQKQLNAALFRAAEAGDLAKVKELAAQGADVNAREAQGLTPLHHAAYGNHVEMAKFLISKGADVNAATWAGRTPLFLATTKEMKALLKEHGAK